MNSNLNSQYKQAVQTVKNQHNRIKLLESELSQYKINMVNIDSDKQILNSKIKELEEKNMESKNELEIKSKQIEVVNIKIHEVEKELEIKSKQIEVANIKIHEVDKELEIKIENLESANQKINEITKELETKTTQLECANQKISEMTADLDKRNDMIYQIDKIILRNNDYFDEVKKELNDKIACGKEMAELYQNTNNELLRVRNEMELLCKELDATKTELQLYKNDFILKSATF